MGRDVLIEFLLELLKEERDHRRKEAEINVGFENLETDLI